MTVQTREDIYTQGLYTWKQSAPQPSTGRVGKGVE